MNEISHVLRGEISPGIARGGWWHTADDGRVQCDLCPRFCRMRDGQKGFCFVREARGGEVVLTSYGRITSYCIDPIEKKPLYHFFPGSSVLSFGTPGCNLGCQFCQNWKVSKATRDRATSDHVTPAQVARSAERNQCASIAFTYNDPIVFAEYAMDCAKEAHARGIKAVAVSNGYMNPEARRDFYAHMDAANIDLKAFSDDFYQRICLAHAGPVLDTLRWLARETRVWLEVTTLIIPGLNDSEAQVETLCEWFRNELGPDVPLHFTAFHPAFKMRDTLPTTLDTLRRARTQAKLAGIRHVYTGNVAAEEGQSTYCHNCGRELIGRRIYEITDWDLDDTGSCPSCKVRLKGYFVPKPGLWGGRRQAIRMAG